MKHFKSFMAPQLQQYADYRLALGYAKKGIKPSLLAFDRYLIAQKATWDQLQPAFFLQLRATISDHPNTVNTNPVSASQLLSIFSATGNL